MPLGPEQASRVYDRIGRVQDTQSFYEDSATGRLAELGAFEQAEAVFELGSGTGRYAAGLLRERLGPDARYLGVDVSPTMVALARERLREWAPRAEVALLPPPARTLPGAGGAYDRFVATYVFDLLDERHTRALLAEAHRLLAPAGRLCVAGLTHGATRAGRVVAAGWGAISTRWPALLGGCRPIELAGHLGQGAWDVEHREVVTRWGVPSEVVVAVARGPGDSA